MRQKQPLDVSPTWRYPLPCPCRVNRCATEIEAIEQLSRLPAIAKIFFWTDGERKCPEGWGFIACVRQGVPPAVLKPFNAWADQYPQASYWQLTCETVLFHPRPFDPERRAGGSQATGDRDRQLLTGA